MHVETLLSVKGGALIIMSGPSPKLDHPRRPRTYVYRTSTPPCTTHYLILQLLSRCFMPGAGIAKINKAQALPEDLTERQETVCYDWVWSVLWQRNTWGTDEGVILIGWRTRYMQSWEERRKNAVSIATAVNVQCSLPTCWKQFWHFKHSSFNLYDNDNAMR